MISGNLLKALLDISTFCYQISQNNNTILHAYQSIQENKTVQGCQCWQP